MKSPAALLAAATVLMTSAAAALDLAPGHRFPTIALPSIQDSNSPLSEEDFLGDKLMLHLFASW